MGEGTQTLPKGSMDCPMCGGNGGVVLSDLRDVEERTEGRYDIARCSRCEFVFLANDDLDAKAQALYPADYHALRNRRSGSGLQLLLGMRFGFRERRLFRYGVKATDDLLEVGCGSGNFLKYLARRWPEGGRLVGFDVGINTESPGQGRIRLLRGALEDISVEGQFDVVVTYDVMEHVTCPLDRFRRIRSWVRPGGHLVVQVPNWDSCWRRVFPRHWAGLQVPRHRSFYAPSSLSSVVEKAGFRVCCSGPVFDPGDLSVSLCNWVVDRLRMKTKPRDVWFYTPLALACAPLVGLQFGLMRRSGEIEILAEAV